MVDITNKIEQQSVQKYDTDTIQQHEVVLEHNVHHDIQQLQQQAHHLVIVHQQRKKQLVDEVYQKIQQ
ncbi:MAG: hypothetical protein LBU14_06600 [Candidatus Peribacteria bacterium]|jgi:hypothetical protein|nr:hypothetical protein [Candidatus Peribacteria bacterium]